MNKKIVLNIILCLTSALLYYFSWPPSNINFGLFLCFVPSYYVVFNQDRIWKSVAYNYLTLFVAFSIGHIDFLSLTNIDWIDLLIGFSIIPILWQIPLLITLYIKKKTSLTTALFCFPVLYVLLEVFQNHWDFSVVWLNLGLGLSNSTFLLNAYQFIGTEGGTFFIVLINILLFTVINSRKDKPVLKRNSILLISTSSFYFVLCLIPYQAKNPYKATLTVFQPSQETKDSISNNPTEQLYQLTSALSNSNFKRSDLLICPETYFSDMKNTPLHVDHLHTHPLIKRLKLLSKTHDTPILSGAVMIKTFKTKKPPNLTAIKKREGLFYNLINGIVFISPDGKVKWRSKEKLMVFTEKTPFHSVINWVSDKTGLFDRIEGSFSSLPNNHSFKYKRLSVGATVCYEGMYSHMVKSQIKSKTNLNVIISTNWIDSQHLLTLQQDYINCATHSYGIPFLFSSLEGNSKYISPNSTVLAPHKTIYNFNAKLNESSSFYLSFGWIACMLLPIILRVLSKT